LENAGVSSLFGRGGGVENMQFEGVKNGTSTTCGVDKTPPQFLVVAEENYEWEADALAKC
jgi:hypothetical protein